MEVDLTRIKLSMTPPFVSLDEWVKSGTLRAVDLSGYGQKRMTYIAGKTVEYIRDQYYGCEEANLLDEILEILCLQANGHIVEVTKENKGIRQVTFNWAANVFNLERMAIVFVEADNGDYHIVLGRDEDIEALGLVSDASAAR